MVELYLYIIGVGMRQYKIIISLLVFCLVSFISRAKPPDIVWRVDTRNYNDIFTNGFISSGSDDRIIEHLSGRSCRSNGVVHGDSAFISTTAHRNFAYDYAERILRSMNRQGDVNARVYIYQIRATENMYSAEISLLFLLQLKMGGPSAEAQRILRYSSYLAEWMAYRMIAAEQVISVVPLYLYQGNVRVDGYLPNRRFVQTRSHANVNPYPDVFHTSSPFRLMRTWMLRMGTRPMVHACFGDARRAELKRDIYSLDPLGSLDSLDSLDAVNWVNNEMFKLIAVF
ncbi:putative enterotoxin subunit [Yersinia enterocolitica]|nr:putative enterotoxin subunit [Yersinia enterocolitica]